MWGGIFFFIRGFRLVPSFSLILCAAPFMGFFLVFGVFNYSLISNRTMRLGVLDRILALASKCICMRFARCTGSNSLFATFRSVLGRSSLFLVTLWGLTLPCWPRQGPFGPRDILRTSPMLSIVSCLNGLAL